MIPDSVRDRKFQPTGKWEAVMVYDSNWGRSIQGLVDPDGNLECVYDGHAPDLWAQGEADAINGRLLPKEMR